jgi:hypothetical protein
MIFIPGGPTNTILQPFVPDILLFWVERVGAIGSVPQHNSLRILSIKLVLVRMQEHMTDKAELFEEG